jgi:hypothetical protein
MPGTPLVRESQFNLCGSATDYSLKRPPWHFRQLGPIAFPIWSFGRLLKLLMRQDGTALDGFDIELGLFADRLS